MNALAITSAQRQRLQVLYTQYERHSLDAPGADRTSRLQWAADGIGRPISSFNDLTLDEAKLLIDRLQAQLGVKAPNKSPRRKPTRRQGEKMGTEGRHDQKYNEVTLAGPAEFDMIRRDLDCLGWSIARMEAFLFSSHGPLHGKTQIRTLGDANRVHWALKRIHRANEKAASERKAS